MSDIRLVIDTATDLPEEIIKKYSIDRVELNVQFGEEDFTGISNSDFYKKMAEFPELPKTSAPSPEKFIEKYKNGDEVIMLTLTQKLSSTFSTALLAKDLYLSQHPFKEIRVIDSENGCIGSGLIAVLVGEMIQKGSKLDEIVDKIEILRKKAVHYGLLETLDNAVKGGRVSRTKGFIANVLNIKPIVEISDGLVKPFVNARGVKNGISKLIEIIKEKLNSSEEYTLLGIAHANSPSKAAALKTEIEKLNDFKEIIISEVGPLMGTYAAEGAVLVSIL